MVFYPPPLRLYLMLSVPAQLVLGAIFAAVAWSGRAPTVDDRLLFGAALAAAGIALIPASLLVAHLGRVMVGPSGVELPGRSGLRRTIAWNAVESVEPVRLLGVRYLKLRTITGRPAWLPVIRSEDYREAIARSAGEEHPITRSLASRPCQGPG